MFSEKPESGVLIFPPSMLGRGFLFSHHAPQMWWENKKFPTTPLRYGGKQNQIFLKKNRKKTPDSKRAAGEIFGDLVCDRMASLGAAGENFDCFETRNTIF